MQTLKLSSARISTSSEFLDMHGNIIVTIIILSINGMYQISDSIILRLV
jgi:hypothetical protein